MLPGLDKNPSNFALIESGSRSRNPTLENRIPQQLVEKPLRRSWVFRDSSCKGVQDSRIFVSLGCAWSRNS